MSKQLTAPQIQHYIDWLGRMDYRNVNCNCSYDDRTYQLLDEIFEQLKQIGPIPERNAWELWFKADRGPIEDFGNYDEWLEDGDVDDREEFEAWWLSEYPTETIWFGFGALYDADIDYRAIFLGNKFVIEQDSRKEKGYEHDISEFAEWLLASVKERIEQIKDGTYSEAIETGLPPQLRTGTIVRREFWDIFPELREDFFAGISKEDVAEFLATASVQDDDCTCFGNRMQDFTANDFFECCSIAYKAIGFDIEGMTPREQYYRHADGRDNGLRDIDASSPTEFYQWLHDHRLLGGHPWEICRGGNSTHIDLLVRNDDAGCFLGVAGSSVGRTIEAIKIYLALRRAGKPVYLNEAKLLAARLDETEKIGVVPEGVVPKYCSTMFSDEKIITYINLPSEKRDEVASHCVWQPLQKVVLPDLSQKNGD